MTAQVRSLGGVRRCLVLLANAAFTVAASAAIINLQSGQLEAYADLSYASTFGWGSSGSSMHSNFGPLVDDEVRGNGGAGAAYSYAIDWNAPFEVEDQLQIFMPWWDGSIVAAGYAVDPAGSSFSSESAIRNYSPGLSLLIEPSEGEVPGTPVLVQIDTHIAGRLSASGTGAIAEAEFYSTGAGAFLYETLSVIENEIYFDFLRSQTLDSAIGLGFGLQFYHTLHVSGEYDTAACAAFAEIREFELTATVTVIPEPGSLVTVVFAAAALLAYRALARR